MGVQHDIRGLVEWFKNKGIMLPSSILYITFARDKWNSPFSKFENKKGLQ